MALIRRKGGIHRVAPKKRATGLLGGKKGVKTWGLKRADDEFRLVMLKECPHKCEYPECPITDPKKLTVSHYHGRARKGTRFYIPNCCFLCRNHHYWDKQIGWEFQKQRKENPKHKRDGQYTKHMKKKLGLKKFYELDILAAQKISPKKAIQAFQASLTT